jgi:hypothetical protein
VQDVLGCQRRDDVQLLGVEQDEVPGDAVSGRVAVIVEEPSCVSPPAALVDWPGRAGPARGRGREAGGGSAAEPAAQAARVVPDRVSVQEPAVHGISVLADGPG